MEDVVDFLLDAGDWMRTDRSCGDLVPKHNWFWIKTLTTRFSLTAINFFISFVKTKISYTVYTKAQHLLIERLNNWRWRAVWRGCLPHPMFQVFGRS